MVPYPTGVLQLIDDQKGELREWQSNNPVDAEAYIASMIEAAVNKLVKPAVSEKAKPKVT